ALVATVVPWAMPARSSADASASRKIASTPRTKPIAGLDGVLATLVTRIPPVLLSTETISVKVPPVSMPIRSLRGAHGPAAGMVGFTDIGGEFAPGSVHAAWRTMTRGWTGSQNGFADDPIGISDIGTPEATHDDDADVFATSRATTTINTWLRAA